MLDGCVTWPAEFALRYRKQGYWGDATLFDVLAIPVIRGRPLTRDDEQPGRPAVAVISQRLWQERLQ